MPSVNHLHLGSDCFYVEGRVFFSRIMNLDFELGYLKAAAGLEVCVGLREKGGPVFYGT
jgi:hypothetical protein